MIAKGRTFQRGNRWWIAYYAPQDDGRSHEVREPAGDTQVEAQKVLDGRMDELAAHRLGLRQFQGPRQERVTVCEILDDLEADYRMRGRRSLPQLLSHIAHIRQEFNTYRALAVTTAAVTRYILRRQSESAANATINREVEALQAAFNLAANSTPPKLSVRPKFPSLPEDNARQGFFDRTTFDKVLGHLGDTDVSDFLDWFFWTGMRPGEIKSLTWTAFDRETWTVRLPGKDSKTGEPRLLALEGPIRDIIQRRIASRRLGCDLIFHRDGGRMRDFSERWQTACRLAGCPGKLPYDLRRTAIRNMTRAGVPRQVAMKISGHRTESVFERYNIVDDRDIRDAVVRTAELVVGR
jgi:integrase